MGTSTNVEVEWLNGSETSETKRNALETRCGSRRVITMVWDVPARGPMCISLPGILGSVEHRVRKYPDKATRVHRALHALCGYIPVPTAPPADHASEDMQGMPKGNAHTNAMQQLSPEARPNSDGPPTHARAADPIALSSFPFSPACPAAVAAAFKYLHRGI